MNKMRPAGKKHMMIYMFGYLPTGPFDLADEDIEGVAIPRTKSRAYKIAVWAGPWRAHQFFLGNSLGGYLHPGWGSGLGCHW